MRNKLRKVLSITAAGCLALALCAGIAGCGEQKTEDKWEKAIAATVDGDINITEKEVNDYIAKYRAYAGYTDDAAWAAYLVQTQMTIEEVRANAIAQVAQNKIVEKYAAKDSITIEDSYIDDYMTNMKESSGIDTEDPNAWTEYLEGMGYTEETYRETVKNGMLLEEVENAEVPQPTPTGDELSAYANSDTSKWTGKNSYTIRFAYGEEATDEEKANVYNSAVQTIDRINETGVNLDNIKAIGDELTGNETAQYAGEAGYDCTQTLPDEYQAALNTLSPGQLYATPVEADGGYHVIYCTEEFQLGADGKININNMPETLYQQLEYQVQQQLWNQAKSDWLQKQIAEANIKVNKCPDGLPYDVDLSLASTVSNENANANANGTNEAVASAAAENAENAEVTNGNVTIQETDDATVVTVGGAENQSENQSEAPAPTNANTSEENNNTNQQ